MEHSISNPGAKIFNDRFRRTRRGGVSKKLKKRDFASKIITRHILRATHGRDNAHAPRPHGSSISGRSGRASALHQQQQQVLDETKRLDHVLAPRPSLRNIDSFCGCFCDRHRRRCLPHTNVPFRFDRLLGSFNCFTDANIRTHVSSTNCLIPQPPSHSGLGNHQEVTGF